VEPRIVGALLFEDKSAIVLALLIYTRWLLLKPLA